ncbi:MAG: Lrp/AsnC ligand binding domain-containing protein [Candidatus Nitrosocosmicus sp.]
MDTAYVVINCKSEVRRAIDAISQIHQVKEVRGLFGVYDIFVKIKCPISELNDIMTKRIKKIKGITSTVTVVVIPDMGGREDISYQAEVEEITSHERTKVIGSPF